MTEAAAISHKVSNRCVVAAEDRLTTALLRMNAHAAGKRPIGAKSPAISPPTP